MTPSVVYAVVGAFVLALLVGWHLNRRPEFEHFCLLDLVAENGRLSLAKFNEFGSFLISSIAVVVTVIKGADAISVAALIGAYATIFALRRVAGQAVHANATTKVRTAEIRHDSVTVDVELGDPRETDDQDGEQPPGRILGRPPKESLFK